MRILVADDDAISRLLIERNLQVLGHETQLASDGTEAWAAFQSRSCDVVISDWMMPGLDGLELCRRVRSSPKGAGTYFILVTSRDGRQQVVDGMEAGADDHLSKPVDLNALQVRLIAAARVAALHHQLNEQQAKLVQLNRELTVLARYDVLTGLRNRLSLDEDLKLLRARSTRYEHPYAISLLDVDHFKNYNDAYGHVAGDHALSAVGAAIKSGARLEDGLYRFGGEEFLCIFPEQSPAEALAATNRIRTRVEALAIPHSGNPPYGVVTLSGGIATVSPGHDLPAEDLLKEADTALYQAKDRGRNRVECRTTTLTHLASN